MKTLSDHHTHFKAIVYFDFTVINNYHVSNSEKSYHVVIACFENIIVQFRYHLETWTV